LLKEVHIPERFASEVNLKPEPELIAGGLHAAGSKQNRIAKPGVLPSEIDLDELVPVPVHPQIDGGKLVRPEVGIGQAAREDLPANVQRLVAADQFNRPRSELAVTEIAEGSSASRPYRIDRYVKSLLMMTCAETAKQHTGRGQPLTIREVSRR
jgi:hypothetical protein